MVQMMGKIVQLVGKLCKWWGKWWMKWCNGGGNGGRIVQMVEEMVQMIGEIVQMVGGNSAKGNLVNY